MTVLVKCLGEADQNLIIQEAFAKSNGDLVLVVHHVEHNRLEAFGVKFVRDAAYFYPIKYQTQKIYRDACSLNVGEFVQFKSDRSEMIWEPETYSKVDVEGVKKLISVYDEYLSALKGPTGLLVPGEEDKLYIGDKVIDVRQWNHLTE